MAFNVETLKNKVVKNKYVLAAVVAVAGVVAVLTGADPVEMVNSVVSFFTDSAAQ